MQLDPGSRDSLVRRRLGAAACALIAAGAPAVAHGEGTAAGAGWQMDTALLLYGEREQARIVEPIARISRLFGNGQRLSAQFGYDAITGASPSGALPSGQLQTTTTPSGNVSVTQANKVPTSPFQDSRYVIDVDWQAPIGRAVQSTLGTHFSREKDYQSVGVSGTMSVELMQRLTTVTIGAGYNKDDVFPTGGTRLALSDSTTIVSDARNPKNVTIGMFGVSRILSRRWLVGLSGSVESERGYLTEPYKVVSLVDVTTGDVTGQVTEKRPSTRFRASVLANSVYHLSRDILYLSYRHYQDDWHVHSETADARYRFEMSESNYLQPHVRYYAQTAANFYAPGLDRAAALPAFASSDYRLGPLRTATIGMTYGFHLSGLPGTVSLRGEYVRQWLAGAGHEQEGGGGAPPPGGDDVRAGPLPTTLAVPAALQVRVPPVHIGSLLVGYSISF